MMEINSKKYSEGIVLSGTLVFGFVAILIIVALTSWFGVTHKSIRTLIYKEQAMHIAEAGIEYYRWHLAHDLTDFQDGTGVEGPYIHDFEDDEGNVIGSFELDITPPTVGNAVVTIESTGKIIEDDSISRTIRVKLAKPSFAKYALVSNTNVTFREGTEVFGRVHSNGGIRFDGLAHNLFSSALEKYYDPEHTGSEEFAVHTHIDPVDPYPPTDVPDRFDVFMAGREFPVTTLDFQGLIADMSELKDEAQAGDGLYFAPSGMLGYKVVLKTDDTFDLYKVKKIKNAPANCIDISDQDDWGTWSVRLDNYVDNYDIPENGNIFFEDDVWVEGQIDTSKVLISAGRFPDVPDTRANIMVNNDLLYTNYDGSDSISLLAQNNINVGLFSDTTLRVDAALIAENGRVGRFYYNKPGAGQACSPYHILDEITLYGMIVTNEEYGFSYPDGTGYQVKNLIYDPNFLYNPPDAFPTTSEYYELISWEELKN